MKARTNFTIILLVALIATGCQVDKAYDLGNVDPEITVMKTGLGFPLGYTMKKSLGEILELDLYTVVKTDGNGDYYLSYRPDPFDVSVRIPADGNLTYHFTPFTYDASPFPSSVLGDHPDVRPDLSQSEIILKLDSGIPASFQAGLSFDMRWNGGERPFSFDGLPVVPGESEIVLKDEKLFDPVPNAIRVNDLRISAEPSQQALLERGKTYVVHVTPLFRVPLSFVAGSEFNLRLDIGLMFGLLKEVGKDVHIRNAVFKFMVTNTIPLELKASGYFKDFDGNRVDDISVSISGNIPGGTLDSPSVTPFSVTFTSKSGKLTSDSFVLELTAKTPEDLAGMHFNEKQSVLLKDLKVFFPDGIQIDAFN